MATLEDKRLAIREIISYYAQFKPSVGKIETEVIFDEANDHYELMESGWAGIYRVHGSSIHIDIRKGKVVIQHDGTPDSIADQLLEKGIPREEIVLAYKPPTIRPYSPFPAEL